MLKESTLKKWVSEKKQVLKMLLESDLELDQEAISNMQLEIEVLESVLKGGNS